MTGEALPAAYPLVGAGQAAGELSERQARVIVTNIERLPDPIRWEHAPAVEAELIEHARVFDAHALEKIARRISCHLDPDGIYRDSAYRERARGITLHRRVDGSGTGVMEVTPELGERLEVMFDTLARPRPEAGGQKDSRTAAQRRHDALLDALELLQRADALPNTGGVSATVVVTMTEQSYRTGTGLAATAHGALVPAKDALSWGGGDLALLAAVIDTMKGITAYSHSQRLFTPQQRLVIAARDRGCTFPGCTAPPGWSQIHHLIDHAEGGPTRVDHGVMVCGYDHRERIRQGWTATLIHGHAHWIPPAWIDPEQQPIRNTMHDPTAL